MTRNYLFSIIFISATFFACNSAKEKEDADGSFTKFEERFLDAYWKQHPAGAIFAGYGKYYDQLVIPDSAAFLSNVVFANNWVDSLNKIDTKQLSDNNKISINIIRNQLESDVWYQAVFKLQQWDPSVYNISGECDYIINQPYAPLDERLRILTKHLQRSDEFYKAALAAIHEPTKEHTELAIMQNTGGLAVFGSALTDSMNASHLSVPEKQTLQENISKTVTAMNSYIAGLKVMVADANYKFRDYRIGKKLFAEKFKYDLATDFTPEQVYDKALADKKMYLEKMVSIANGLWQKYYASQAKPADSMQLVQMVIDKIQLQHASAKDFYDTLTNQVHRLKRFIIEKDLFDFDTITPPIKVRYMPEYLRGVTIASAEFTPPYQKQGATYYNIDDLTKYDAAKAEGSLKEYNNYSSQLLSIHEAVPGHCLQGIYNNKKSPDVLRAVFQNGAMAEGWAVYTEDMMLENGWGDGAKEMELMHHKLKLRELANVLIDYDIQCNGAGKEAIVSLLTKECFQTSAQAEEKYKRATLSQVQLCSYYAGASAIQSLRDEYKTKMGDKYSLKAFHEMFLSFGCSPVKYIRERMPH